MKIQRIELIIRLNLQDIINGLEQNFSSVLLFFYLFHFIPVLYSHFFLLP